MEAMVMNNKRYILIPKVSTIIAILASFVFIFTPTNSYSVEKSKCANAPLSAVKACIWQAAKIFKQPYGDALRVAKCESTFNPFAQGVHLGLFQFLPSTWQTTPYRNKNALKAKWNARAAMWMWAVGRRGEWECQ